MTLMTHRLGRCSALTFLLAGTLNALGACAPSSLVEVDPPNTVADPAVVATPAGATQMYSLAVSSFANIIGGQITNRGGYVGNTGLWTDELLRVQNGIG